MSIRDNGAQVEELNYTTVDASTIRIDSWKAATSTATMKAPPAPIASPEPIRVEEGNLLVVDKGVIRRGKTDYLWNEPAFAAKKSRDRSGQVMRKFAQIMEQQRLSLNEQWPLDLKQAIKLSDGELTAEMLVSATNTALPNHYLYVRPSPTGKSTQPLILENPELNKGAGSMVVYCDHHVGWVDGDALWKEATRLAALPKSRKDGIDLSDWTVPTSKP